MTLSAPVELPDNIGRHRTEERHETDRRDLDRQRAGMVRHRRLRLLRRLCVEGVLPEQRPDDVVAADLRHVRAVVPGRPIGGVVLGAYADRLRPQGVADGVHRHDDVRHARGGGDADLCDHRHSRADRGHPRASGAGIFRRWRIRQLDRVSGRARAGPARLHRKLAVREPGPERIARRRISAPG